MRYDWEHEQELLTVFTSFEPIHFTLVVKRFRYENYQRRKWSTYAR